MEAPEYVTLCHSVHRLWKTLRAWMAPGSRMRRGRNNAYLVVVLARVKERGQVKAASLFILEQSLSLNSLLLRKSKIG